ncbi:MAG: hypothetical protein ABDH21_03975 [bacterium]
MIKILVFILLILSIPFCVKRYYQNIVVNHNFDNFYTGMIDNKAFIAKDIFSRNKIIIATNDFGYSEGIFINQLSDQKFMVFNISNYLNRYCIGLVYFNEDLRILQTKILDTYSNIFVLEGQEFYTSSTKMFVFKGLIQDMLNLDSLIIFFDNQTLKGVKISTSYTDYPFFISQYSDENFEGFLFICIMEKNTHMSFIDIRDSYRFKRLNYDSILVCFIDKNLMVKKEFAIRFPRNVVDLQVIKRALNGVLIRVDFIDSVSGYVILTGLIEINYKDIILVSKPSLHNQFYVDSFMYCSSRVIEIELVDKIINFDSVRLTEI